MSWYEHPYPLGNAVRVLGFPRPLYPPDAEGHGKTPSSDGPDVEAYKRITSRLGRWPWQEFDEAYSNAFAHGRSGNVGETGVAGVQRQQKIDDTGWVGPATFDVFRKAIIPSALPHGGEHAMDSPSVNMINEAWQHFHGTPPPGAADVVKVALADYCHRSILNTTKIHYQQFRPMNHLGVAPEHGFTTDCSGFVTGAYYWARLMTAVAVPDPNHLGYSGWGFTGTLVVNPRIAAPYQQGDLAIYGTSFNNTTHVTICTSAGDAGSSGWTSHGSEAGPRHENLFYRPDLLCVVRPKLVP